MFSKKIKQTNVDFNTLSALPLATIVFDLKNIYLINKEAATLFNLPIVKNKSTKLFNVFKYLSESDKKKATSLHKKIIQSEKTTEQNYFFQIKKSKKLFVKVIYSIVFHNEKKAIQATFINQTELNNEFQFLNEIKTKFELITNNTNEIICFYSYIEPERYLYVSPNIERILGFKPEELLRDHNFFNKRVIFNKREFLKLDGVIKDIQKRNSTENYSYTFKILKKKKEEIWLENNLTPIANKEGKVEFILNVIKDITERKEKELLIQTQNENYENLIDNAQIAYVIHNQGIIIHCNDELLKILGYKDKKSVLGKFAVDFFIPEQRKKVINRIKDVYNRKKLNEPNTYFLLKSNGKKAEVEIRSSLTKYNNTLCILSSVINVGHQRQMERDRVRNEITEQTNALLQKEIKEKEIAEKTLLTKTAQLTAILENSNHLIWSVNRERKIVSFNKNYQNQILKKYKTKIKEGDSLNDIMKLMDKGLMKFWKLQYEKAFNGESLEFERVETSKKNTTYRQIFINPIYDAKGVVTEASCIGHNITAAKVYEQKLQAQSAKLNAIFESSHHYIWAVDLKQKLTSFNKNYSDLVAMLYNTQPHVGLELNRGVLSNDANYNDILQINYAKAFAGKPANFELETVDKNYNRIYLDVFLNPIMEENRVIEVSGIAHDITEKKTAQQRMEQSLKEKEVLLKEVHHRVKNNMQVISSILNLQSSYVTDEYTLALLKESQNRIKTMAYIHESLYQNKSFTSVNFSSYITTLTNNIIQSYVADRERIKLELNIEKINLSLDNSIPAGLIINELVTNSLKHGFKNAQKGLIIISLKSENNTVYLEVKDDGKGIDPKLDLSNTNSLGLQLVNALVDQMSASIKFNSVPGKGTSVVVVFKM
ncbi:MAG: PAS domain S-box protein [Sphingobacteriaceae bacterium]|nr:PAS domain S-box protein [Sphingobacteriaceae bacterium]